MVAECGTDTWLFWSTVITNPDDPNFDLEKVLAKWEAEYK